MAKKRPQTEAEQLRVLLGEGFIEQRTHSLATVYLTRRDDLLITEAANEEGVDLLVAIKTKSGASDRRFGVILEGTTTDYAADQANAVLKPAMEALAPRAFSYPVCLLFFLLRNDWGLFTWVAEPVITPEGNPALRHHTDPACVDFDKDVLDEIVDAVSAWYDAFSRSAIDSMRIRRKANGIEVLHGIIDGEAAFFSERGESPKVLNLPVMQAYELAKLGREHLGDLAGRIIKGGVRVLEQEGLLGMKVKLVTDQPEFSFE